MTDETPVTYQGPERVLSGVQPSGDLHLGNYLGALKKFVDLQHRYETFIFVADLHAITVWQDPGRARLALTGAMTYQPPMDRTFEILTRWRSRSAV